MKKLLIILTAIFLSSCDEWRQKAEDREIFLYTMKVGDEWKKLKYDSILREADIEYSKYSIEGRRGFYYITVKNDHIVSIWVKPKPY